MNQHDARREQRPLRITGGEAFQGFYAGYRDGSELVAVPVRDT